MFFRYLYPCTVDLFKLVTFIPLKDILPLDDYITQVSFPEETEALKMELSRSNSLFKFGDSRDALYNMLYYQFYVKRINLMPKDFLQYGCQCQILSSSNVGNVAKDPLDASCVNWQQCRTCVTLEKSLKNGDNFCDPLLEMYPIGVNVTNGELSCILTTSNCQKTTCECDVKLVNQLVANIDSFDQSRVLGYNFDQKWHCRRSSKGSVLAHNDSTEQPQNDSMFRMELESLAFDDNNEKKTQKTTTLRQTRPNRSENNRREAIK
ncbi:unnamed protein product [Oikopleura dioica]|uniref:Phospholipase A2 domain-containing protein n=1 Tax=Oikopleura dioica TaxID=34765 RepID=E4XCE3_OIKDI|nr:unnamed protein product [Oikopleura dioica]